MKRKWLIKIWRDDKRGIQLEMFFGIKAYMDSDTEKHLMPK